MAHDGSRPKQQTDLAACRVDTPSRPAGGSRITIDLKLDGDVITDYAHELKACVIGQAVASVLAQVVAGLPAAELHVGAAALRALLKDKTLPTSAPWTALEPFLPVADVRSRHGSALLPFEVLERALDEIGRKDGGRQPLSAAFDREVRA